MSSPNFSSHASFIWSVADLLRGDYKQSDYGKVILPFTVLRRLDCVLESTKPAVLKEFEARKLLGAAAGPFLTAKSGFSFYNTSPMDFAVRHCVTESHPHSACAGRGNLMVPLGHQRASKIPPEAPHINWPKLLNHGTGFCQVPLGVGPFMR